MLWRFLAGQRPALFWGIVILALGYTVFGPYTRMREAEDRMNDPHAVSSD